MDTPEKCQIQTPVSKFEDSPVFNFINNLSPIEPVKTTRISQTFNSLTFTTIPSIFASPHLHSNRDSRFLRRPGCYRSNVNELDSHEYFTASVQTSGGDPSPQTRQNLDTGVSTSDEGQSSPGHEMPLSPPLTETSGPNTDSRTRLHEGGARSAAGEENPDCDWECLISDSAENLLGFNSLEQKKSFPGFMNISASSEPASSEECKDFNPTREDLADGPSSRFLTGVTGESVHDGGGRCLPPSSEVSVSHRGLRRRCLVFDMTGTHRKSSTYAADGCPPSDPINHEGDPDASPSSCILPGIGLHLNSLALSDSRPPDIPPLNLLASLSPHEQASSSLAISCVDTDKDSADNDGRFPSGDVSGYQLVEEICQSSPMKKRPRLSQGGEDDSCKRCNCKKSKCLKLYCECFAAGVYCADPCSCQECFNKSSYEDMVLATRKQIVSRNPLAFAPKVIRASDPFAETGEESNKTPTSARHKRGCNCKKSNCLKKYCECYQGGVGCSLGCRCEGCRNTFGRKEGAGSSPDEEAGAVGERILPKRITVRTKQEQITHLPLLATPLNICRPSSHHKLLLRSSTSSSDISTGFGNPDSRILKRELKDEGEATAEEVMPDILSSPNSGGGIKSASPNSKRVSPPGRNDAPAPALSPSRRGGRKLILQSIPAFPSLTPGPH